MRVLREPIGRGFGLVAFQGEAKEMHRFAGEIAGKVFAKERDQLAC